MLAGRKLHIVPFSHVDWAWVNSRAWMVRRHAIVLSEVLDLLKTTPDFRFYIEQWNEQLEPFLQRKPERAGELRRALQAGKVQACGGVTNQHPGWMESESLLRDMTMGRRLFREFAPGLNLDVMIHVDVTPGSSQMPQILRKAGYHYYRIHRPDQSLTAQGIPLHFIWKGLDGTKLLTSRGFGCGFIAENSLPDDFASKWEASVEKLYKEEIARQYQAQPAVPVWMPLGCDDARPMRHWHATGVQGHMDERPLPVPALIQKWNASETSHLSFSTPLDFFRDLEKNRANLPEHDGILDPTMWTYWYGLNGNRGLRLWRTRTDETLVRAERWWSLAASSGSEYPQAEFNRLWRDLLRAYSHAQMWLFEADYDLQLARVKSTLAAAESLETRGIQSIAGRVKLQDRPCVLLFNDLPWERKEVVPVWAELQDVGATNVTVRSSRGDTLRYQVEDVNWYELPGAPKTIRELKLLVEATVPALGYTTLYFESAPGKLESPPSSTKADRLDAGKLSLQFSSKGIEALIDNETGAKYTNPGNIQYNEINDTGPYHYGPVVKVHGWTAAKVEAVIAGSLRSSVRISGKVGPHSVTTTAYVYPTSRRLAFDSIIQSAGGAGHFMTGVGLPARGSLVSDIHFGVEDRDVTKIVYEGEERRRKNVFYGAHWTSYSSGRQGLTLVGTTGEKGYQYFPEENTLGHFLLMTNPPNQTWERLVTKAREGTGEHRFDYQFLLHSGDWKSGDVVRRALEARSPIRAVFPEEQKLPAQRTLAEEHGYVSVQGQQVQLSALHRQGSTYILRCYESHGDKAQTSIALPFRATSVREVDFNGVPMARKISTNGAKIELEMKPWEIVTLAVES
jgi:alpha-mannosidase